MRSLEVYHENFDSQVTVPNFYLECESSRRRSSQNLRRELMGNGLGIQQDVNIKTTRISPATTSKKAALLFSRSPSVSQHAHEMMGCQQRSGAVGKHDNEYQCPISSFTWDRLAIRQVDRECFCCNATIERHSLPKFRSWPPSRAIQVRIIFSLRLWKNLEDALSIET